MSKFIKYVDITIPVEICNFRCKYCYLAQERQLNPSMSNFKYSAQHVAKGLSVKRLGGTCLINICGSVKPWFHNLQLI